MGGETVYDSVIFVNIYTNHLLVYCTYQFWFRNNAEPLTVLVKQSATMTYYWLFLKYFYDQKPFYGISKY